MPLYEYKCIICESITEEIKPIGERNTCPYCSKCNAPTTKVTTKMNFELRGSGWGKDGYSKLSDKSNLV